MNEVKQIETEIISIKAEIFNGELTQTINARQLHSGLGSKQEFSHWIKARIKKAYLTEGRDFTIDKLIKCKSGHGVAVRKEYTLTLDAGKHISMMEDNEMGFKIREYFIACEKEFRQQNQIEFTRRLEKIESTLNKFMGGNMSLAENSLNISTPDIPSCKPCISFPIPENSHITQMMFDSTYANVYLADMLKISIPSLNKFLIRRLKIVQRCGGDGVILVERYRDKRIAIDFKMYKNGYLQNTLRWTELGADLIIKKYNEIYREG